MSRTSLIKRFCVSLMLLSLVNLLFDLGRSEEHAQKQRKVEALYYAEQTSAPLPEGADRNRNAESRKQRTQNQADRRVVSSDTGILVGRNGTRTHSSLGALRKENPDTVAWLSVPGTPIDYPVVQCKDVAFYLNHNFFLEPDAYGCLFVKEQADLQTPGTNFVIYGHNMRDGSMFGSLISYENRHFYENHKLIRLDTGRECREYEVMSVLKTHLFQNREDTFKYYQFYQANTEEEFKNYNQNLKALSLYDTGVTASYGDHFLTLSTCSSYVENGRLAVVARQISPEPAHGDETGDSASFGTFDE